MDAKLASGASVASLASAASIAARSSAIRVTLPVNVANDIDLFGKMLRELGDRIGCKPCISGSACFFDIERDFVVNPAAQIVNVYK